MYNLELTKLTIKSAHELLIKKEIGAIELTCAFLDRIQAMDNDIEAYITVCKDFSLQLAGDAQKKIDSGNADVLCGIPVSIKDNMCIKDIKTTCASKMLENFIPPYTSTAVQKLMNTGAVVLGKVNMDEFAMGGSTETSYYKKTKNPHDLTRVPGGSSGGSAASVAASLALGSLGSDTGGSIRQPAAFCGVVGLKPTYGLVSRYGLVAFASSLDQIGPIAKTVEDSAIILDAIAGKDNMDGTSVEVQSKPYVSFVNEEIKGFKVGIPSEYLAAGIDPEVKASILKAIEQFVSMGAEVEEFSMPSLKHAVPAYYLISSAEASSNLSRYDGIKYGFRAPDCNNYLELVSKTRDQGFGREVKRRILLGTYALASGYYDAYYKKALKIRTLIRRDFEAAFNKYNVVISPTAPTTAFKIGENIANPLTMYLADIYTVAVNIAGLPAISVPCGTDKNNLPIGLSIIGKPFGEPDIIKAAAAFERAL